MFLLVGNKEDVPLLFPVGSHDVLICSPMSQSKQIYWKRSGIPPNEPQTRPETFLLHRHMINFVLSNNFSRQARG